MTMKYTYDFADFPYVDKTITIPVGSIFYRGIPNSKGCQLNTQKILRKDVPIYIGPEKVARAYCSGVNDAIYILETKKEIKLIDIRKVIAVLPMIMNMLPMNSDNEPSINALKISTLQEQIQLLSNSSNLNNERKDRILQFAQIKRYIDTGIRIPITNIDRIMLVILKTIFGSFYQGVIAPRLYTPFEASGYSHEEILIFDPYEYFHMADTNVSVQTIPITGIFITLLTTPIHIGGRFSYEDKNIGFNDKKWLAKYTKLVKKQFKKLIINPDMWADKSKESHTANIIKYQQTVKYQQTAEYPIIKHVQFVNIPNVGSNLFY